MGGGVLVKGGGCNTGSHRRRAEREEGERLSPTPSFSEL